MKLPARLTTDAGYTLLYHPGKRRWALKCHGVLTVPWCTDGAMVREVARLARIYGCVEEAKQLGWPLE